MSKQQKRFGDEAMLSMLEGGVRAARKSAGAHNRYAVGLYAFGRRGEAIEHLRKAGELSPRWPRPYANLEIIFRLGIGEAEEKTFIILPENVGHSILVAMDRHLLREYW